MRSLLKRFDDLPRKVHLAVVVVAVLMLTAPYLASAGGGGGASDALDLPGFDGVAGRPVVPSSKATLVAFDHVDLADDLAYLAAVPASTFFSEPEGTTVSSPLLFYQPPMDSPSTEETALDAGVGVEYFMEDYVTACGGSLGTLMTVGLPRSNASQLADMWSAGELVALDGGPGIATAAEIAKASWEWSDKAVVAVLDPMVTSVDAKTTGNLSGTVPGVTPGHGSFSDTIEPSFHSQNEHNFDVGADYKYVMSELTWNAPGPFPDLTQRGKELGLHLFAGEIMVALSSEWNAFSGSRDTARSFVYTPGSWKAAVVFIPTMGVLGPDRPTVAQRVYEPASYTLTYDLYGGTDVIVPDIPAAGSRNGLFTLTWQDAGRTLGLFLRGPSGQEIAAALQPGQGRQVLEVPELGEGAYTVSVVDLDGVAQSVDFEVEYSWESPMSDLEVDSLVGATEAAVLASELNAPLLYATPGGVPSETADALDILGTQEVLLVDLTGSASRVSAALEDLRGTGQPSISVERVTTFEDAVARIVSLGARASTDRSDIVFSTLNPWSYWHTNSNADNPQGEEWGGRYFGPAAYAAANHGCPVLITEADPRLSCSAAWHNSYWLNAYAGRGSVPVGAMYLTGQQIYDAVASLGLDGDGMESILTVAGQFELGTAWDRALVGPAAPGRVAGTPVDASYWVARGVLYPLVIFANPAVDPSIDPEGGRRIVGSESDRSLGRLNIVRQEQEVEMDYPVAFTWACFIYKFNERASKYWGAKYVAADGTTPGESPSDHPFDDSVMPDICEDVFERYSSRAGYGEAESAGYDATIENLNRGCIMWYETMHGSNGGSGFLGWWSSTKNEEANPHRAYEEYPQSLMGSTRDPDVVCLGKYTGLDTTPCTGPVTDIGILPERHDGVVIAYINQDPQTDGYRGTDVDADLRNIHSCGVVAGSCSISNTFLHLSMIRHGSAFQIIDPWLTSWYVQLGAEIFYRDVASGDATVGEAYEHAISLVGSKYLTGDFWWDHWENIVFFGEPDIRVYTPAAPFERPPVLGRDLVLGGHSVMSADEHPNAISGSSGWLLLQGVGAVLLAVEAFRYARRHGYLDKLRSVRSRRSTAAS